jgi:hypothetical protein
LDQGQAVPILDRTIRGVTIARRQFTEIERHPARRIAAKPAGGKSQSSVRSHSGQRPFALCITSASLIGEAKSIVLGVSKPASACKETIRFPSDPPCGRCF